MAAALLALSTVVTSCWLEATGRISFSSDQGIISLMALDILQQGAHPVFCYGSEYAGALSPTTWRSSSRSSSRPRSPSGSPWACCSSAWS